MSTALLAIEGLSLDFETLDGVARVLDRITIVIRQRETVGLVGETGCGKSITAKAVLDALPMPPARIRAGRLLLRQHDLLSLDDEARRQITTRHLSYIPQDPMTSLNPTFTIGQQMVDLIAWQGRKRVGPLAFLGLRNPVRNAKAQAIELLGRVHIPAPHQMFPPVRTRSAFASSMAPSRGSAHHSAPATMPDSVDLGEENATCVDRVPGKRRIKVGMSGVRIDANLAKQSVAGGRKEGRTTPPDDE